MPQGNALKRGPEARGAAPTPPILERGPELKKPNREALENLASENYLDANYIFDHEEGWVFYTSHFNARIIQQKLAEQGYSAKISRIEPEQYEQFIPDPNIRANSAETDWYLWLLKVEVKETTKATPDVVVENQQHPQINVARAGASTAPSDAGEAQALNKVAKEGKIPQTTAELLSKAPRIVLKWGNQLKNNLSAPAYNFEIMLGKLRRYYTQLINRGARK